MLSFCDFEETEQIRPMVELEKMEVTMNKVKIIGNMDIRKSIGPENELNLFLRECKDKLADKKYNIIQTYILGSYNYYLIISPTREKRTIEKAEK